MIHWSVVSKILDSEKNKKALMAAMQESEAMRRAGDVLMPFGKHKGKTIIDVEVDTIKGVKKSLSTFEGQKASLVVNVATK